MFSSRRATGGRKGLFLFITVMILVGAVVVGLRFVDYRRVPPRIDSTIFTYPPLVNPIATEQTNQSTTQPATQATSAPAAGPAVAYFITMEERTRARRLARGSMPAPRNRRSTGPLSYPYLRYVLHAVNPATGEHVLPSKHLLDVGTAETNGSVDLLGIAGGVLWTHDYNKGLQAHRLNDLSPIFEGAALEALRPEGNPLLPKDPRHYKVIGPLDALVVQGTDARNYRVDPTAGKLIPLDDEVLAGLFHTKRPQDGFTYSYPAGQGFTSQILSNYRIESLTIGDQWYALLTPENRKTLNSNSATPRFAGNKAARTLCRGKFRIDDRGYRVLDLSTLQDLGDTRYLVSGFLRRPGLRYYDQDPWLLPDGSFLILHRASLEDDSPHLLTRLRPDGTQVYQTQLPLIELTHFTGTHDAVLFAGFDTPRTSKDNRPHLLLTIDPETGTLRNRDLSQN